MTSSSAARSSLARPQRLVDRLDERALEAGDVGAALGRRDDVDERAQLGVVAGPPPQRHVDRQLALDLLGVMWPLPSSTGTVSWKCPLPCSRSTPVTGSSGARCSANSVMPPLKRRMLGGVVGSAARRRRRPAALVAQHDRQARDEERGLAGPPVQRLDVERGVLDEDLPIGPVADPGAGGPLLRPAGDHQPALPAEAGVGPGAVEHARHTAPERHRVDLAVPVDLDVQPRGQRVHHRRADPVQPARRGVRPAAELAAGVEPGQDHLDAGEPGLWLDVHRDAAPVVAYLDRPVRVQHHLDPVAVAGQGLVDRVVDDLPEAVHEPAAVRGPDVHAGALAHGVQALEHGQVLGRVATGTAGAGGTARPGRGDVGGCAHAGWAPGARGGTDDPARLAAGRRAGGRGAPGRWRTGRRRTSAERRCRHAERRRDLCRSCEQGHDRLTPGANRAQPRPSLTLEGATMLIGGKDAADGYSKLTGQPVLRSPGGTNTRARRARERGGGR